MDIYGMERGTIRVSKDDGELHGAVAITLVDDDGVWVASLGNEKCPMTKETAMLIAHSHNNFLRLLKALKRQHEGFVEIDLRLEQEFGAGEDTHNPLTCETCKLIAEMEEVKEATL